MPIVSSYSAWGGMIKDLHSRHGAREAVRGDFGRAVKCGAALKKKISKSVAPIGSSAPDCEGAGNVHLHAALSSAPDCEGAGNVQSSTLLSALTARAQVTCTCKQHSPQRLDCKGAGNVHLQAALSSAPDCEGAGNVHLQAALSSECW